MKEAKRREAEQWRQAYTQGWEPVRQAAIARARGRCEVCGSVVYERRGGSWRRIGGQGFGAAHHVVPLSQGGTNDAANVAVLCSGCHGLAHSKAMREAVSRLRPTTRTRWLRILSQLAAGRRP